MWHCVRHCFKWCLIFFPKFEENKDFSNISTKMEIFLKISKKIQENKNFLKFSYNYIHLTHVILYVAVADDLVPRFIARSSAFFSFKVIIFKYWHILCGTTGHSVPLHRLCLTCVVISGPGLESNQDTKYLSVTIRNCRTLKLFIPLRLHMIYIYIYLIYMENVCWPYWWHWVEHPIGHILLIAGRFTWNKRDGLQIHAKPTVWPWLWPQAWPRPWIFKVRFWNSHISRMGVLTDKERNWWESIGSLTHYVTFLRSNFEKYIISEVILIKYYLITWNILTVYAWSAVYSPTVSPTKVSGNIHTGQKQSFLQQ